MTLIDKHGAPLRQARRQRRMQARYLRDDRTGVLSMRRAATRDGSVSVRESAYRASALAWDFMHNSGWIAGAADQVISDTIGVELKLNFRPDLTGLGYDDKERSDLCRIVEAEWRRDTKNGREVDLAGKASLAEMLDGVMRYYLAGGEGIGIVDYLSASDRRRYGISTGTKYTLVAPHRLKRDTNEIVGLDQGIYHDANGRPTHYLFRRRESGIEVDHTIAATDGVGLRRVVHVMDRGENPDSPRGISVLAPILRVIAQHDQLADATLATALMQAVFAATIKSPEPSEAAFEAIRTLEDDDPDLADDLLEVWSQRIDALKDQSVSLSDPARINHLGPGEEFEFHTPSVPGSQYLPLNKNLHREMARRLGVLAESFTLDFSGATYSSMKMGVSSIWPVTTRRRSRIAGPFAQGFFEPWLDEKIRRNVIPFKGGYRAFEVNRHRVCQADWQGPSQPTADDYKSALAEKQRLENGTSSLADECALQGKDWEEVAEERAREKARLEALGLPVPFERMSGGAGPLGAAADGNRDAAEAA